MQELTKMKIPVAYVDATKPLDDLKKLQNDSVPNAMIGRMHDIR